MNSAVTTPSSLYTIPVTRLNGTETTLIDYQGKVLLIVNTASRCGFTPQYADLETLYQRYRDQGLVVLGFPCNQFGAQEPGSAEQIAEFCSTQFNVSFPLFAKVEVNGEGTHPVFQWLKTQAKGLLGSEAIKWNFTKFLVDRQGVVVERYAPTTNPLTLSTTIETFLTQ